MSYTYIFFVSSMLYAFIYLFMFPFMLKSKLKSSFLYRLLSYKRQLSCLVIFLLVLFIFYVQSYRIACPIDPLKAFSDTFFANLGYHWRSYSGKMGYANGYEEDARSGSNGYRTIYGKVSSLFWKSLSNTVSFSSYSKASR